MGFVDRIIEYVCIFVALLVVLPFHEFGHAFAAVKNGDNTPKLYGRYTLNPMAHFDKVGLICFVLARFGWAKPVPVNPNNFRNYKKGCILVSIAGVLCNYITAFIAFPLFVLSLNIPEFGLYTDVLQGSLYYVFTLSITFFVFNLLPLYPLDGFRLLDCFSTRRSKLYQILRNYGTYILLGLMVLSIIADYTGIYQIDILGFILRFVGGYVSYPIQAFWGLFF